MKQTLTFQEKFLKDLHDICKKYRVNISNANVEMYYDSDISDPLVMSVDVNGAWPVKKEYDAVIAEEIVTTVNQTWHIRGDK